MKSNKEIKKDIVSEIESLIDSSQSIIVWRYHGVDSQAMAKLRMTIKDNSDTNKIFKNRLAKLAFQNKEMSEINESLIGPNAFLFLNSDSTESLKAVNELSKDIDSLEFVGGFIDNQYYDAKQIAEIAGLPSKTDLVSMLLSVLQAPMRNAAYAISQIKPNE